MKKLTLLKSMLLLCALVAGSTSVWATVSGSTTLSLSSGSVSFTTPYNNEDAPSSYPAEDATVLGDLIDTKTNKYQWSFKNASALSSKLQIKASSGLLTSPTITSVNGFTISITYTFSSTSNATASIQINDETAQTKNTEGTLTATTSSTSASVKISAPNKRALYITNITITPNALPATFAVGKTMISFSNSTDALDFTDANRPAGLKAYKVSTATAETVTLTEVTTTVAKNTGLILTGTASTTYNIPVVASGTDISSTNKLVASDGTNVTDAYVLSSNKFHPVQAAGIVIPAGKAYLPASEVGSHALDIEFDNGEITGIQSVENQKTLLDGNFYNLAGQRVAQPAKGLYIVNGKKTVIK